MRRGDESGDPDRPGLRFTQSPVFPEAPCLTARLARSSAFAARTPAFVYPNSWLSGIMSRRVAAMSSSGISIAETAEVRSESMRTVKVWDVAVRIFHWLLVLLIVASWATGQAKGNWMTWHMYSGYAILTLILFRIAWGFVGSTHARFSSFIYGPSRVFDYVFGRRPRLKSATYLGHNALGGWMVLALLVCLLVQAGTGLFANDDIVTDGPLVKWISKDLSDRMTGLHHVGFNVLLVLAALHIGGALLDRK